MRTTGSPVPAVSTLSDSPRASATLNVSTVVELAARSRTANSHTGRCLHGNGGCRGGGEAHTDAWRPASGRRGHSPVRRLHITRRARPLVGRPPSRSPRQRPSVAEEPPGRPVVRSPYRSVHTASSLPLGSVKWNRRPPGKENAGFTIFPPASLTRSEEHTSELQSRLHLVCRLLLEKKKKKTTY